jgi:isochorismate synthase
MMSNASSPQNQLPFSSHQESDARRQQAADPRAIALVEAYREGDALFCSGSSTWLGKELVPVGVPSVGLEAPALISRRVVQALDETGGSVVIGALPFEAALPSRLVVPRVVRRAGPLPVAPRRWLSNFEPARDVRAIPSPEGYRNAVSHALSLIESKELTKVVVGRLLELDWRAPLEVAALVKTLLACRRGLGFAIDIDAAIDAERGRRTLFGISPELLVRRSGKMVTSRPLAGSVPRHEDSELDQRAAQRLLVSEKDRREHAVVVEAVVDCLHRHCTSIEYAREPSLVQTETLWHLGTEVRGVLKDPTTTSLELALALHPTPAVAGYPLAAANQAIGRIEASQRGFFTGAVGWCDARGDGEWAVTIRAGEVELNRLRLFAGAGIVAGSVPALELAETSAKLNTLLRVLGVACDSKGGHSCP